MLAMVDTNWKEVQIESALKMDHGPELNQRAEVRDKISNL